MIAPRPSAPCLTDRAALSRQRARALRAGDAVLDELHGHVRAELHSRLAEVNRTFTAPAVVTGYPGLWDTAGPGHLQAARVVPDDPVLDLQPGAHDLVIHAMALHWADDPLGQIIQCARALRPDGLFLAVMPGGRSLHELRAALAQAESDLTGGLAPRVLPMAEIRDAGALLQRAGLALPVADADTVPLAYRNLSRLVADLRATGEGNALAARHRAPLPRAVWAAAQALYARSFADAQGLLPVTLDLIWLTGWAPADSQPRPLRPGSATTRLADALGSQENPLPDPVPGRPDI
jgi:SAM-dependent methyltransferase